jgi:hypothetical protein
LGLQPAPIEFSLSIFVLAPLFHARFSRWRLVSREPILGLSAESLSLPRLISLAPDLSPVHASLVRWSEWLPILFVCADPVWILCPIAFFRPVPRTRFCIHVLPLVDFLLTLLVMVSLGLFPVEHMGCSLDSSKWSILVQISYGFWCGLLQDLVSVYS